MYDRYYKYTEYSSGKPFKKCSPKELKELKARKFRDEGMFIFSGCIYC
jgi:hypothetical protein